MAVVGPGQGGIEIICKPDRVHLKFLAPNQSDETGFAWHLDWSQVEPVEEDLPTSDLPQLPTTISQQSSQN